jgi:hypothetical protein
MKLVAAAATLFDATPALERTEAWLAAWSPW